MSKTLPRFERHKTNTGTPNQRGEFEVADFMRDMCLDKNVDPSITSTLDTHAALAALLTNSPFGLVNILDEHNQHSVGAYGFPHGTIDKSISICATAIQTPDNLYVVGDLANHEIFADSPWVTDEPYLRAYLGAPLVTSLGDIVGMLCTVDVRQRRYTDDELDYLRCTARHVVYFIEMWFDCHMMGASKK